MERKWAHRVGTRCPSHLSGQLVSIDITSLDYMGVNSIPTCIGSMTWFHSAQANTQTPIQTYTHTHTHTHTHTLSLSLTHTHTHTHTTYMYRQHDMVPQCSNKHTNTYTNIPHSLTQTHTHTLSLSHAHTHTKTNT